MAKTPWYHTDVAVILFMIFFFPVGLALLWTCPRYKKRTKWAWTIVVAAIVLGSLTYGVALILIAIAGIIYYFAYYKPKKEQKVDNEKLAEEAAAAKPSGKMCPYCGAPLRADGTCEYCGMAEKK